jgi:hypothetical protein
LFNFTLFTTLFTCFYHLFNFTWFTHFAHFTSLSLGFYLLAYHSAFTLTLVLTGELNLLHDLIYGFTCFYHLCNFLILIGLISAAQFCLLYGAFTAHLILYVCIYLFNDSI